MRGTKVLSATRPDGVFRTAVLPPSRRQHGRLLDPRRGQDEAGPAGGRRHARHRRRQGGHTRILVQPVGGLSAAADLGSPSFGRAVVGPDTRPALSVHGLTHAREPAGMATALHFADDLISKYGTDPTATYLLDHRQIYIIPVTNPGDKTQRGLLDHQRQRAVRLSAQEHQGHERQRRGRDQRGRRGSQSQSLYQWGLDDVVAPSGDPTVGNYRGIGSRSPSRETQAIRDLLVGLRPQVVLDFHSYSDMLMFPWSYTAQAADDSAAFKEWTDDMTLGNGYQSGQARASSTRPMASSPTGATAKPGSPRIMAWTAELGGPTDLFCHRRRASCRSPRTASGSATTRPRSRDPTCGSRPRASSRAA